MTEHYAYARLGGTKQACEAFKRASSDENKAVRWVADVANATRHVVRLVARDAIGFRDIQAMEMGQCGVMRCGWPMWGEEIIVGTEHQWRLSELIECAMGFWRQKLGLDAAASR
jgi:hypothetical protein